MTTNIERAAEVIYSQMSSWDQEAQAMNTARDLAEAGLLMPDPPEPQTRTLADMTPDERQACVGMWCDNLISAADVPAPVVLACVQGEECWILHTSIHGERSCFPLDSVAPRPDLPRAWSPAGTPPTLSG